MCSCWAWFEFYYRLKKKMVANIDVRILELRSGVDLERNLFRLQKGLKLRFTLSPFLQPYHGKLFCNHPDKGTAFKRTKYQELKWTTPSKTKCDDGDRFAEITTHIPGSFHFYFTYTDSEGRENKEVSGYFVVDPVLCMDGGEHLPLDCVALQTYLAKCLGPLSQWKGRLRVAQQAGYNMIHLTPVQELGGSRSAYSLHDQLKLNSSFDEPNTKKKYDFDDLKSLIQKLHKEWKMFFVCDIVLNHTSNCTPWLRDHPECAYNMMNSPHLRPAYVVDEAIWKFSSEISRGIYDSQGIPVYITHEHQLGAIHKVLSEQILPALNLWEFFGVDVNKVIDDFKKALVKKTNALKSSQTAPQSSTVSAEVKIVQDPEYKRLGNSIDIKKAVDWYLSTKDSALSDSEWIDHCCSLLRVILESLNNKIIHEDIPNHIGTITHNIVSTVRYERLEEKGPRHGYLTKERPLVSRYFIDLNADDVEEFKESTMYTEHGKYIVAHPGWVMGGDALNDFAAPGSLAYFRREVIIWGDSVKLRYGKKPEDAPFLWSHMMEYVKLTASIFHGIRLDNCHSTPIHVAEYFIDGARRVRPDLYVVAELFTDSDRTDNVFVNRLGLTSLIREAMSAHDSHEQGRLVHRYGGEPVGAFFHVSGKPMVNSVAHALYMDVTHDNPNPTEVRSVYDCFPTAALVNMACCATGSTRGNDEFVPHHVNVVTDNRRYLSLKDDAKTVSSSSLSSVSYQPLDSGMISARRSLNELHRMLAKKGYNQVFVDQMSYDIVAVTRHCPENHQTVVLVAHTAFSKPQDHMIPSSSNKHIYTHGIKPLHVEGNIDEILLEGRTIIKTGTKEFLKNPDFINGLESHVVEIREHVDVNHSQFVKVECQENSQQVYFESFPPGSVIAFKISLLPHVQQAVDSIRSVIADFSKFNSSGEKSLFQSLNLDDINRILYRCDAEERADGHGGGAYNVPRFGPFVYCGIQGFMSAMSEIRTNNDLGHPVCHNLREGNWLMDYTAQRLLPFEGTKQFAKWLHSVIAEISKLPRYMVPSYFDVFITLVYAKILERALEEMSPFIRNGSVFLKSLAMGSVQLVGSTISAPLPGLSPRLAPSQTSSRKNSLLTISAGLPHFSVGLWRSWGRDTFISLRGLLLVTGRFQDARNLILAYGGCIRHGLIPNLLNGGTGARYNCRDAAWWWLQSIQDYCEMVPHGVDILKCPVTRMYPKDESDPLSPGEVEQPLYQVIQEVMQRHFNGISFRERNAGPDLDRNAKDEAFNVEVAVDKTTGFVYGGSEWNNGTWMDKVGESHIAGNVGVPATPRDGSAVEIVGLCKSAVRWLAELSTKKIFPFKGVTAESTGESWSYAEWDNKIHNAFEEKFWISEQPDLTREGEESRIVNKRGIYKDSYKASHPFTDYQLRPNFPIAMVVAPEMFDSKHAWTALETMEKHLLGPLGVATLDPEDWAYDGVYDNSQDSDIYKNARGFNYHQGPEWLWVLGPYLRAKLHFSKVVGGKSQFLKTVEEVRKHLSSHYQYLLNSPWHGLPELTNVKGAVCKDSCDVQAWSMACLLDVFYDMEKLMV